MVNEIWRDIKGYEGLYQVSSNGVIRSLDRYLPMPNGGEKLVKEKILKPNKINSGYLCVGLSKNGKTKNYLIHRLVGEHFIDNSNNLPQIDHINTDKTDNRVCNLKWVTSKGNMNNPLTIDKINIINKKSSKPIIQFSKDGEFIRKWNSVMDAQRELGIDNSSIIRCCKGKQKTAGGYIWRYHYKSLWLRNNIPLKDKLMSA